MAVAAVVSAGLAGAVVAMGVMWIARPTRVVVREAQGSAARPTTTVMFAPAVVPSQALAKKLAPSLVIVQASRNDQWADGTGVRLDDRGTIAVAALLVDGADSVVITDATGKRLAATPAGSDPATGIAIVHIADRSGSALDAAPATAEAGQPVAVIGASSLAPDGSTEQRVITAAISAVDLRTTLDSLVLHDAVQLDRAVPTDARGGVVIDADGHLLGIVLAGSGAENLAVVVPAGEALAAARDLRTTGTVRRAWLGVRAVDLSPTAAQMLDVRGGALLQQVEGGSPAAATGLLKGDVITDVDGHAIGDASDLVVALRSWKPGERVVITWRRGVATRKAGVILGG